MNRLVTLYRKTEDYTEIHIFIGKKGKIATHWRYIDREGVLKGNKIIRVRKRRVIHNLKINGCAICGYNKCDNALDFHHTNPQDKKFGINICNMGFAEKRIAEELNKCILLCKNCHYEIHTKEIEKC